MALSALEFLQIGGAVGGMMNSARICCEKGNTRVALHLRDIHSPQRRGGVSSHMYSNTHDRKRGVLGVVYFIYQTLFIQAKFLKGSSQGTFISKVSLFKVCTEQTVTDIANAGLHESLCIQLRIYASDDETAALRPHLGSSLDAGFAGQNAVVGHLLDTPIPADMSVIVRPLPGNLRSENHTSKC